MRKKWTKLEDLIREISKLERNKGKSEQEILIDLNRRGPVDRLHTIDRMRLSAMIGVAKESILNPGR